MAEIDRLLKVMAQSNASDLHLSCGSPPIWRLYGDIMPIQVDAPLLTSELVTKLVTEIMPPVNRQQYDQIHDTDFGYETSGIGRFRVNVFLDRKGPGATLRLIPSKVMAFEEIGLPKVISRLCYLPKGLILVTGPTGSGKSTTLASMIDFINRNHPSHIITIEDPIEFVHENKKSLINQREINSHTSSFKHALRAALREDPDILLVGEMRDLETIETAIEIAETGHLVFGTLHTSTAASTVDRIIEQFSGPKQNQIRQMLSTSLKAVVSQALLKRKDGKGRVAAVELLLVNTAISNLIREEKTYQIPSIMQTSGKMGMVVLNDALTRLVSARLVSPEEAYHNAIDKDDYQKRIAQLGISSDISFPGDAARPANIVRDAPTMIKDAHGAEMLEPAAAKTKTVSTDDFKSFRERLFKQQTSS